MGKPPKPLEPLINALSALNTDTYVLALKSAALHLQVSIFPSLQRSRLAPAAGLILTRARRGCWRRGATRTSIRWS